MTSTTTTSTVLRPSSSPRLPSPSTSSLSSINRQSSQIVRTYKYAHQLFLTRRVHEALEVLEPVLRPAESRANGPVTADSDSHATLISSASRGARIKVWSLYISILNAIAQMSSEQGKRTFGSARWKELVAKARNGTIWEDVIKDGYGGVEGDVDADVVVNLATLLLAHATSQNLNQQRLETYLSSAPAQSIDMHSSIQSHESSESAQINGTNTPRELTARLKILEIYTLHVLPRNNEWDYAREFLSMSDILEDERREGFLQALQALQDEKSFDSKREQEIQRQRDQQLADVRRREDEERKLQEVHTRAEAERLSKEQAARSARAKDFGVDKTKSQGTSSSNVSRAASTTSDDRHASPVRKVQRSSAAARRSPGGPLEEPKPSPSFSIRASSLLATMQHAFIATGQTLSAHPMALFRFVVFMIAFLMAVGRRDVRALLSDGAESAWVRIRRTVGMGVQVSYV